MRTPLALTLSANVIGVVLTGCASEATNASGEQSVTSSPTSNPSTGSPFTWLLSVMPDATEVSRAAGYQVAKSAPPTIDDASDLRDPTTTRSISEHRCIGVAYPFTRQAFSGSNVLAIAYETNANVTYGVVALESPAEAQAVFDRSIGLWQSCDGATLVTTSGTTSVEHQIAEATTTAPIVSAVVTLTGVDGGATVRNERALGVTRDCVVDVEVGISGPVPGGFPPNRATELATAMLSRCESTPRQ